MLTNRDDTVTVYGMAICYEEKSIGGVVGFVFCTSDWRTWTNGVGRYWASWNSVNMKLNLIILIFYLSIGINPGFGGREPQILEWMGRGVFIIISYNVHL